MHAVPWRRAGVILGAVAIALVTLVVALRADGFPPIDAAVPRATRWFVAAEGRVVLADGFSGTTLVQLEAGEADVPLSIVQSPNGVAVIDTNDGSARTVDATALRLGPAQSFSLASQDGARFGVGQTGLVAVDPASGSGVLVPSAGDAIPFEVADAGRDDRTQIAPDGAIWTIADDAGGTNGGRLRRVTSTGEVTHTSGLVDARFTLVGNQPLVLDPGRQRARFGNGDWVALEGAPEPSEIVLQVPGPTADCGWIGGNDRLWCVGEGGVRDELDIAGLDIEGADRLGVAGDAAAVVRAAQAEIVRLDLRSGRISSGPVADVPPDAALEVSASLDLIWVDETDGNGLWAVHPWGINYLLKDDGAAPILSEDGDVVEGGTGGAAPVADDDGDSRIEQEREPDNDGIDDPPVAEDDPVTARTGGSIPIAVTANDYDPDGDAIALVAVGAATRGQVEILDANTAVYRPTVDGAVLDEFEYTITDAGGNTATAMVYVQLLPVDAANQAPVGAPDMAETSSGREVDIDVLANDIDPERDPLSIASFSERSARGSVREVLSERGLPGLRFTPDPGYTGTTTFAYRPIDSFGAIGDEVEVTVQVARSDQNREPVVRPDAVRVRRNDPVLVDVLANDVDPDGDTLFPTIVQPLPDGIDVTVVSGQLQVTAAAGAPRLASFSYEVSDRVNDPVRGDVLVVVLSDDDPNLPPVTSADSANAVVGTTQLIDVLSNDDDPDNDPLTLLSVEPADEDAVRGSVSVQGDSVLYRAPAAVGDDDVAVDRFVYWITDGRGHPDVKGELAVRILPEPIDDQPSARDDAATTFVDQAVTIDVLANDRDPSGGALSLVNVGCPGGGTAEIIDDRITYRPPDGLAGVFNCDYAVVNMQGAGDTATIYVTVVETEVGNDPPIVNGETDTIREGETKLVDVLANDSDPDDDRLELVGVTAEEAGVASIQANQVLFDASRIDVTGPGPRIIAVDYTVTDGQGAVVEGTLTMRVLADAEPLPPVATADENFFRQDTLQRPQSVDVLSDDSDPDGDNALLRIVDRRWPSVDGVRFEPWERGYRFTADDDFTGEFVVAYTIEDEDGQTASSTSRVIVEARPNSAPIAVGEERTIPNGQTATIEIALNDSDPDGDDLTYSIVSRPDPALGTARLDAANKLLFTSVPEASGTTTVVYRVTDGSLDATAIVTITVLPCSVAAPVAESRTLQTGYMEPIEIRWSDYASNGEVVDVDPDLDIPVGVYRPPAGENGNVRFDFVVRNACGVTRRGTITIDVNQDPDPVPDRLAGVALRFARTETSYIPMPSLASDDETLTIRELVGAPSWISIDGSRIRVNPGSPPAAGAVDFVAVVADTGGLTANVPVRVELVNQPPTAQNDTVRADDGPVLLSALANDFDLDTGRPLGYAEVPSSFSFPNGASGTIEVRGDQLSIDPRSGVGTATFTYRAVDDQGALSNPATVTVIVNGRPSAPDVPVTVDPGKPVTLAIPATDPENDPLTLSIPNVPAGVTITRDGLTVTITAGASVQGQFFDIAYVVTDPRGASATGSILLTVTDPPPPTTTTTVPPTTVPPTTNPPPTTLPPPSFPSTSVVPPITRPPDV